MEAVLGQVWQVEGGEHKMTGQTGGDRMETDEQMSNKKSNIQNTPHTCRQITGQREALQNILIFKNWILCPEDRHRRSITREAVRKSDFLQVDWNQTEAAQRKAAVQKPRSLWKHVQEWGAASVEENRQECCCSRERNRWSQSRWLQRDLRGKAQTGSREDFRIK